MSMFQSVFALAGRVAPRLRNFATVTIALLLLTAGASAPAQAQVATFTGTTPASFSAAGQVITFHIDFGQSNAVTNSLSFPSALMNYPTSNLNCSGFPVQPFGTGTCTFTYTTQPGDVGNPILQYGQFIATDQNGGTRQQNISNQQSVPFAALPSISISNSAGAEGNSGFFTSTAILVTLSAASSQTVTVNYATSNGTATAGSDYIAASGTLTFSPGQTTQAVVVGIGGDTTVEGNESFTITLSGATNATIATASATRTLTNDDAYVFGPAALPNATVGAAYSQSLTVAGGTLPFTFSAPSLPPGLTLASDGTLSGTPTGAGAFTLDVTANDGANPSLNHQYTLTINAPTITVSPTTLANGTSGVAFNRTLSASGGTAPYSFTVTAGAPPAGVALSSAGVFSGTPTTPGTYNFTVRAQDALGFAGARAYSVVINPSVPVAGAVSAAVAYNSSANPITLNLSGGAPASVAIASAAAHGTATASGTSITYTPTAGYGGTDSFTYTATNVSGTSSPATVTITVSAPTITLVPSSLANGRVGSVYPATSIAAAGGTAPYAYAVTAGVLATGLILNPSTGTLSGTPTALGTFNFTITATDSSTGTGPFTGSRAYAHTIVDATPIAGAVSDTVSQNSNNNPLVLSLSGGPALSVAVGTAPTHGTTIVSGTSISYTPTAGYAGPDSFTYTATNSGGSSAPATVTITVAAPTITLPATLLSGGTRGSAYSAAINGASGGTAPYSYTISAGAMPTGVSVSSGGVISGTPNVFGTFTFTITATDSSTGTGPFSAANTYSVSILDIVPGANAAAATVAYDSSANPVTLNLSGGAATSVAVASAPSHGTAIASGTSITYTPTAGYAGPDSFTYTATNASGTSAPATITITVADPAITVAAGGGFAATVGTPYSQTFTWSGGAAPYSAFDVAGLPAGLAITASTANSVTVSGTPTAAGSFALNATAADSSTGNGPFTTSQPYTLTVAAPALALSPASATFTTAYAAAYSQAFSTSGGVGPYTYAISGALPAGVSLSGNSLSGTPTVPGNYPVTVTATDTGSTGLGAPFTASQAYTLSVTAATVALTPATLPAANAGTAYAQALSATGAVAPYTYTISAGALPPGVTLASNGNISGTPTTAGTYNFTVLATDANAQTGSQAYSIAVAVPTLALTPATIPAGTANSAYSQAFTATGGIAPYSFALTAGTLPTGMTLSNAGVLSGTPTASGTFNLTVSATDSTGGTAATASTAVSLVIATPTLSLSPATLAMGEQQQAYSQTFTATGGIAPYTFAVSSGSLPAGLALNATTGVLAGTPTANGSYTFALTATDSTSGTPGIVVRSYTVVIALRPDPSKDAEVLGLLEAQAAATRRFAEAQIGNFRSHLEGLHDGGTGSRGNNLSFSAAAGFDPQSGCATADLVNTLHDCQAKPGNAMSANAGEATAAASNDNAPLVNLWIGGVLRTGDRDASTGREGFDFETDGISVGADYRVNDAFVIGGGVGIGHDNTDVGTHGSRVDGDAYTAAIYGSYHPGEHFFLDGIVGNQWLSYDLQRYVTTTGGQVYGQRDGGQWLASLSAGFDYGHDAMLVSPYLRWDYARADLDAYVEQGSALWTLRYDQQRVETSSLNLGLRLENRYETSWGAFSPQFRVEYQHDLKNNEDVLLSYADTITGPVYRASLLGGDRNRFEFGLGGIFDLVRQWRLRFEYRQQKSDTDDSKAIQLNVEKQF